MAIASSARDDETIRAGIELPQRVSGLTADDGNALAVRIGIATGQVVVGDLIGKGAAQEQAVRVVGFDDTHAGVLRNPDVAALLDHVLDQNFPDHRSSHLQ